MGYAAICHGRYLQGHGNGVSVEETPPELPLPADLPCQGSAFPGEGVQNEANSQGSEMNARAQILPRERRGSPHSISTRHTKLLRSAHPSAGQAGETASSCPAVWGTSCRINTSFPNIPVPSHAGKSSFGKGESSSGGVSMGVLPCQHPLPQAGQHLGQPRGTQQQQHFLWLVIKKKRFHSLKMLEVQQKLCPEGETGSSSQVFCCSITCQEPSSQVHNSIQPPTVGGFFKLSHDFRKRKLKKNSNSSKTGTCHRLLMHCVTALLANV